jgi:hypothetical protein
MCRRIACSHWLGSHRSGRTRRTAWPLEHSRRKNLAGVQYSRGLRWSRSHPCVGCGWGVSRRGIAAAVADECSTASSDRACSCDEHAIASPRPGAAAVYKSTRHNRARVGQQQNAPKYLSMIMFCQHQQWHLNNCVLPHLPVLLLRGPTRRAGFSANGPFAALIVPPPNAIVAGVRASRAPSSALPPRSTELRTRISNFVFFPSPLVLLLLGVMCGIISKVPPPAPFSARSWHSQPLGKVTLTSSADRRTCATCSNRQKRLVVLVAWWSWQIYTFIIVKRFFV